MRRCTLKREQILDTSKGLCVACGSTFKGSQLEHLTTQQHATSVRTYEEHQIAYQLDAKRRGVAL